MTGPDRKTSGLCLNELLKIKSRSRRAAISKNKPPPISPLPKRNDLTPTLQIVTRDTRDLIIPSRNVRSLDPAHVREVANAIAAFGFSVPVLIDDTNEVIDGVVAIEAARMLGLHKIPCVIASHLTPSQKRQLRLTLNRLQEKGSWALPELKLVMEELILEGISLEITGFTQSEIDQIVLEEEPASFEEGSLEPDLGTDPISKLGDIRGLGPHRVICGDARDPAVLGAIMSTDQAQLILTDEPFNVPVRNHVTKGAYREFAMASGEMSDAEFGVFNTAWMQASLPHLRNGGILGTFIDWRGYPIVHAAAVALRLTPLNLVVWGKSNAGMGSLYRSQYELLPLFKVGKTPNVNNVRLGKDGRWRSNLWTYPGASSFGSDARKGLRDHPTTKPTAMLEDALLDLTNRGDIVLDPFLGSGSTLIAAEKTGRRCRGVEIDPRFLDVIVRRYEAVTGKPTVLERLGGPVGQ